MSSLGSSSSFTFIPQFRGLRSRSSVIIPLDLRATEGKIYEPDAHNALHDFVPSHDQCVASADRDEAKEVPPTTVLVVDDSSLNRKILMKRLRVEGFVCYEADDGDLAVQMIRDSLVSKASTSSSLSSELETPILYDVVTLDNVSRDHPVNLIFTLKSLNTM